MDKAQQYRNLASKVLRATRSSDWGSLVALDREIAAALPRGNAPDLSLEERQALVNLERVHNAAREHCLQETTRVRALLRGLGMHREGWLAYSSHDPKDIE